MNNWRLLLLFTLVFILLSVWGWHFLNDSMNTDKITIYFLKDNKLQPVKRKMNDTNKLDFALAELLKGPNVQERSAEIFSEIPADLTILQIKSAPDRVILVMNDRFSLISGGTTHINALLAQIVYTVNTITNTAVDFQLANSTYPIIIGGEGIVIDHPLTKADFKEFADGH
jgi:spore germination protein GerM